MLYEEGDFREELGFFFLFSPSLLSIPVLEGGGGGAK